MGPTLLKGKSSAACHSLGENKKREFCDKSEKQGLRIQRMMRGFCSSATFYCHPQSSLEHPCAEFKAPTSHERISLIFAISCFLRSIGDRGFLVAQQEGCEFMSYISLDFFQRPSEQFRRQEDHDL